MGVLYCMAGTGMQRYLVKLHSPWSMVHGTGYGQKTRFEPLQTMDNILSADVP